MFHPPRTSTKKIKFALLGICLQLCPVGYSQDFTTSVGNWNPLGLGELVPMGEAPSFGTGPGLKGGFAYGLGMQTIYDSNLFLQKDDPEDEVSTVLLPWASYTTDPEGGAKFSVDANYHPALRAYLNNPDLNGVDQSADITLSYVGSKLGVTAYSRYSELSGTDRLTGQFVTGALLNNGIQGTYQIAPRTSVSAHWAAAVSDYGSSSLEGAEIYTVEVGGYWAATERFNLGPGVRYTLSESANTGSRDAWAVFMQARYQVGERIQVSGTLGFEYANSSRDAEESTLGLTGNLAASYAINELWAWRSVIQYVTVPSPTYTNYVVNNVLISTGVSRILLRATVDTGLDVNFSSYQGVGPVGTDLEDENNIGVYVAYRRKLFSERLDFESKIRYAVNKGQVDWEQLQVFAGLEIKF